MRKWVPIISVFLRENISTLAPDFVFFLKKKLCFCSSHFVFLFVSNHEILSLQICMNKEINLHHFHFSKIDFF